MSLKKNLIIKLLANDQIVDFEENLVFRVELQDHPEAVRILLDLLRNGSVKHQNRIYRMLICFSALSLSEIAYALSLNGALWRHRIFEIMWSIVNVTDEDQYAGLFQSLKTPVVELLSDTEWIPQQLDDPIEIEYQSRVCDEAYLFCQFLINPEFNDSDFLDMDEKERNSEILTFKSRIDNNLLIS